MRHLNIDMSELELAFGGGFEMTSYSLDLDTGEVISVSEEARNVLDTIYEAYYDEQTHIVDWENAFEKEGVPDWQRDLVKDAHRVETNFGDTFISIPSGSSSEGFTDMVAFIDTVRIPQLKERLVRAINRRGPFRNFKEELFDYPSERERWFKFKRECLQSRILEWLEEHDITLQE